MKVSSEFILPNPTRSSVLLSQPLYHCVPWLVLVVFSDFTPKNVLECVLVWREKEC